MPENKKSPTFTDVRTITVARIHEDDELKFGKLIKELHKQKWNQHLQRVSAKDDAGHFSITFKDTKSKTIIENMWETKVKEGKLSYRILKKDPIKEHIMELDDLPEEVPTRVMEAYLSKYLINPKMTITLRDLTEYGMGMIEIGEATVSHKGIRRPIPRRIWVGPGVSARVKSDSQIPWHQYKILCSFCKEEGHKAWSCTKQTQCFRCKATTRPVYLYA